MRTEEGANRITDFSNASSRDQLVMTVKCPSKLLNYSKISIQIPNFIHQFKW